MTAAWPLLFVIPFHALLFHAMPRFSRPGILFSVTVPNDFANGAGNTLVSRYRAIVWTGAAIALAAVLLIPAPEPGSRREGVFYLGAVAGNLIVGMAAWLWAHRTARAHAAPPSEIRVASLVPRDTSLPGGALFACGPFVILLIAAVFVAANWDQVPEDARMTGALAPLTFGALYVVMMLTMAVSLARRTRQIAVEGMALALEQRFRRLNVLVFLCAAYGVAMMVSTVAIDSMPAIGLTWSARIPYIVLPVMVFGYGVTFWMFRVGQGGQRAVAAAARPASGGDSTPDDAWKLGGLFYYNPSDPAVWVEKRVGLGYTLNIGNSSAWLLIGLVVLPVIAAPLLFG